jgi:nitroimidazol reductase NimA-like FMN-containing flavoprotein (pyridoxamine 5'-phosphate oxidase superfamily)
MSSPSLGPTPRTRVQRLPKRAAYDLATLTAILDQGLIAHLGFVVEGQPYVIPTIYGRLDRTLYLHGSAASRMLRTLAEGVPVCATVSLIDGLVLARSAFHHSMNYRSVVVIGRAALVEDAGERLRALRAISDQVAPGRWDEVREPNEKELRATSVLRLPLEEASAKVRTGPPLDDPEDLAHPAWAGVLPLSLQPGAPIASPDLAPGVPVPAVLSRYGRGRQGA